ncbi:hypothetical protein NP493_352g01087 [Ridgeia piscesae]|uniref:Uncharacterized protein n=1 Tax=Ridgeia piscesae TaxID=27915 RepID=A0AAD9L4X7_RIDPI|nr:hypothetical protein NP493_352g01087 [Ridgeia piscesae]
MVHSLPGKCSEFQTGEQMMRGWRGSLMCVAAMFRCDVNHPRRHRVIVNVDARRMSSGCFCRVPRTLARVLSARARLGRGVNSDVRHTWYMSLATYRWRYDKPALFLAITTGPW